MKMNKYMLMSIVGMSALALGSCDKDTEGLTWTTYYADIAIEGGDVINWEAGVTFVDPGYVATMDGEDISDQVEVSSDMDFNNPQPGVYTIEYSYVNSDGFGSSATRTVGVWGADDPVAGFYIVDSSASYRLYNGAMTYFGGFLITVEPYGIDGYYYVDDMLGGWYCQRAGYGTNYAMQGLIYVDSDGAVDLVDSYVLGWGDEAEDCTDGRFDADENMLHWNVEYTTYPMNFIVTMYRYE